MRSLRSAEIDAGTDREPDPDDWETCLNELFESQVDKTPDAVALVCGDLSLTYAELDRRSSRLAHLLRRHGAGPGKFVAIYFERSELPIVAILACHKSGAAYLPIDPAYPSDRIRYIVGELGLSACLTELSLAASAADFFAGTALLVVDDDDPAPERLPETRIGRTETGASPRDLAYVIYTSGTTGRPKGVMTEHQHVTRFVRAFNEACGTTAEDRVYQGFSLGFDGSVEEIWMAFSNGSTLVVPTRDAPRLGDELAGYLNDLAISYFSTVPTLLSTLPDVPSLRTVVLSGEVCRPELVSRWARPDLRILNVYGPTEATVNTTVAECEPGRQVTIGTPLPGYRLRIVDEALRPVLPGQAGELLISGNTLARGYFNQPQTTRERFLTAADLGEPGDTRYYRTGDLVRWNEHGELEFHGRLDGQVKIRGYRVELAEIESVLQEYPRIASASVALVERDGLQELAAYVTARAHPLDRAEILALLETRLPEYMLPGFLDVLTELPRTTSGKVDRKRLPPPETPLVRASGTSVAPVAPETGLERVIAEVWSGVLAMPVRSIEDDFFLALGGHSLLAARAATKLREQTGFGVTVRDLYQFSTVRQLARHLESVEPSSPAAAPEQTDDRPGTTAAETAYRGTSRAERGFTTAVQACSVYLLSAPVAIPLAAVFLLGLGWVRGTVSTGEFLGWLLLVTVLTWPALLLLSVAAKWLLIGRYRPGEHRLWGSYYLRWWLTERIGALAGVAALSGTPVLPLYYRLMGARVGARCTLDTVHCSAWDLVSIGADTSIGASTQLLGYRIEDGMLRLGRVDIGDRCFVGIHSALGLGVRLEDDARLEDQTLLPDSATVPAGEGRRGSPAREAELLLPDAAPPQSRRRRVLFGLAHLLATQLSTVVLIPLPATAFLLLVWFLYQTGGPVAGTAFTLLSVPLDVVVFCAYLALLKRAVSASVKPGTFGVLSGAYFRKWLADGIMSTARTLLLPVYTTVYLPPLLRLMGAKIGRGAEISTVWSFAPELIDVAGQSFFADGSIVGGRRTHRGSCEIAVNRIGHRSFVGNGAIVPVGARLGDHCLLGVQSIPPADKAGVPDGTEWLGSPSFALTHRVKVGGFGETVTFSPTRRLYLQRAVIDGLRVLIPFYLLLFAAALTTGALLLLHEQAGTAVMLAVAPLLGFASAFCAALVVPVLKKAVMGTYRPEIKPLWSKYVWLNEMINGCYESVLAPVLLPLLGTPFAAGPLRLMGCRIGRRSYLGSTLFSEFDLVEIGDYAALNHGAVVQNHLFEDRIFKSDALKIGDGASVGNMSVVLYDTEIEPGAVVGPLSLLMKGETLRPRTRWHGIPTQPA
ncbi:Pls/PosA family non-ribosomal peptide synthetase [Amycolatopsis nigrescens]|uniref:Pls/PosA family non-ribosomal peptide synthetase n=1 Tax=Amycolatopsis nigrescens TaxID=381445 RepID=UPI000361B9A8|nr:Pls/PosA family non-ribosomal peptide synthetase [Amycolatopsis nigrescens]